VTRTITNGRKTLKWYYYRFMTELLSVLARLLPDRIMGDRLRQKITYYILATSITELLQHAKKIHRNGENKND
jgi:hypothetical protein